MSEQTTPTPPVVTPPVVVAPKDDWKVWARWAVLMLLFLFGEKLGLKPSPPPDFIPFHVQQTCPCVKAVEVK